MLSNYSQKMTSADLIFQMHFFLGALRVNILLFESKSTGHLHIHSRQNDFHNTSESYLLKNRFTLNKTTKNGKLQIFTSG